MDIRTVRARPPAGSGPVYRYGTLAFILGLLACRIHWHLTLPPAYSDDPYMVDLVVLMLLINHLTHAFKWPRRVNIALSALGWSWIAFTFFYILYLSRVLYPLE